MQTENVNIVLGLPASAATEVAALYFDIFPRKLGVALGRHKGIKLMADHLTENHIFVAWMDDKIAGIAGFKYNGVGMFQLDRQAFLNCFAKTNWRLEVAWDREFELADIIDRIEDRESPKIRVEYDKDLTWCQIILANSPSTLLITNGTFQISRQTPVAPRDLIDDLINFQSYLLDQLGAPGIGQVTVVSPDT